MEETLKGTAQLDHTLAAKREPKDTQPCMTESGESDANSMGSLNSLLEADESPSANPERFFKNTQIVSLDNLDHLAPPPIVVQPRAFSVDMLDPVSKTIYSNFLANQVGNDKLRRTIQQGGDHLQTAVHGQFASLKGNMTYKELLAGLMYEGENLQGYNQFNLLAFTKLEMTDQKNETVTSEFSTGGICLVTNKRLLLLSSQTETSMGLEHWVKPNANSGSYSVTAAYGNTTSYQPIPLRYVRSVQMKATIGASGKVDVHSVEPCCGSCFFLCGACCANARKRWQIQPLTSSQTNIMVVTVGVLMPPWKAKRSLQIHVNENVPVAVVHDFVSLLQTNTPSLK